MNLLADFITLMEAQEAMRAADDSAQSPTYFAPCPRNSFPREGIFRAPHAEIGRRSRLVIFCPCSLACPKCVEFRDACRQFPPATIADCAAKWNCYRTAA